MTCPSCHQKFEKENLIMFGYVVINKPELKIKDYDKYQEYYCGLCQSLKTKSWSPWSIDFKL